MQDIDTIKKINENKVCSIIRGSSKEKIIKVAEALLEGGVKTVEVTFNTPGAVEMIKALSENYGDRLLIGAGTVLDSETAKTAIDAGAKFVLSPTLNLNVVRTCQRYNIVPVPGVMTPTEALTAWENGVRIVKVFPAGVLGAKYIKQLKGPLSQVEIMAVGAVSSENLLEFYKAGASSAGIGGELVNSKLVEEGRFDEITDRARNFINIVEKYKKCL